MTNALRALVVDDSAFDRRTITSILSTMQDVEVVGKAIDGNEALQLAVSLKPDFITLDLEMPRMDGFSFLRLLMARRPTPVLVISGRSDKNHVFKALELGALDFIAKPGGHAASSRPEVEKQLSEKVSMLRQLQPVAFAPRRHPHIVHDAGRRRIAPLTTRPERIGIVAASTGGPPALVELFTTLPSDLAASVVVAQHMPERFTKTFAERLDRLHGLQVCEANHNDILKAGHAYVCPGGRCVDVVADNDGWHLEVVQPSSTDRYVPSADRAMISAAKAAGSRVVAAVLTGMGDDGTLGAEAVHSAGGLVVAESSESAAINGMPGSAVSAGFVDEVLPLGALGEWFAKALADHPR